jgi:hypothetical protein
VRPLLVGSLKGDTAGDAGEHVAERDENWEELEYRTQMRIDNQPSE